MKKILSLLFFIIVIQLHLSAQNVGIGTTLPADKLTVKTLTGNFGIACGAAINDCFS